MTQQTGNSIPVSVIGKSSVPTATVVKSDRSLALSLSAPVDPTAQQLQPIPEQSSPEVPEAVKPETAEPEGTTPSPATPEQPAESAPGEEAIEIVVTGEREDGYSVPNATVGTRTDTPLRDIPQSIQVVPQELLRDQQAVRELIPLT